MKTISFRVSDNFYSRLIDLKNLWNKEDQKCENFEPYNTTDVLNICIGRVWDQEFAKQIFDE